jgi:hypothetical protein
VPEKGARSPLVERNRWRAAQMAGSPSGMKGTGLTGRRLGGQQVSTE